MKKIILILIVLLSAVSYGQFSLEYSNTHKEYYGYQISQGTFDFNNTRDSSFVVMFINNSSPTFFSVFDKEEPLKLEEGTEGIFKVEKDSTSSYYFNVVQYDEGFFFKDKDEEYLYKVLSLSSDVVRCQFISYKYSKENKFIDKTFNFNLNTSNIEDIIIKIYENNL